MVFMVVVYLQNTTQYRAIQPKKLSPSLALQRTREIITHIILLLSCGDYVCEGIKYRKKRCESHTPHTLPDSAFENGLLLVCDVPHIRTPYEPTHTSRFSHFHFLISLWGGNYFCSA